MSRDFQPPSGFSNIADILRWRANEQPDQLGYTYLVDGENEEVNLTYSQLDRRVRAIAAQLQWLGLEGQTALMLYPPGLEYVEAFYACFYAGVIAVPAYPPEMGRLQRSLPRLQAIAKDAGAKVVLTTDMILGMAEMMAEHAPDLAAMRWLATDAVGEDTADMWNRPKITGDTIGFLQYTSGSTGTPKGVMISHRNLLHNEECIQKAGPLDEESTFVSWLPQFHDMGLIGAIMQPLFLGSRCVLMSPIHFLQRPLRWLKAVVKYRGVVSGGPNFAYELCVKKIKKRDRDALDLSHWTIAFNGAEPVRVSSMERFSEAFAPAGFKKEAFFPCYGLAESTVYVTGVNAKKTPPSCTLRMKELAEGRVVEVGAEDPESQTLVGCGHTQHGQEVRIVNTETFTETAEGNVGEIWISGPSVAEGYWGREEATNETFKAFLSNGEGPYLRTGDVGFMLRGSLYVTGRIKDLVIIRGRNYYPQDIELTVEQSHPAIRPGCTAAFPITVNDEEVLAVVAEVDLKDPSVDLEEVVTSIRRNVAEEREISVHAITLIRARTVHKTSSGKIQRQATRKAFMAGTLDVVSHVEFAQAALPEKKAGPIARLMELPKETAKAPTGEEIDRWLARELAQRTGVPPESISLERPFTDYGLDSRTAVELSGDLSEMLDRSLPPTLLYDYPNIKALAAYLGTESGSDGKLEASKFKKDEPIAIVGLSCRLPGGVDSPDSFWRLLDQGVDAITEVPENRWDVEAYFDPERGIPGKMYTRWGGFVDHVEDFDAPFFGIAPREATAMDPQQRLLLEVSWEALENAGLSPDRLMGSPTGVYMGISTQDYCRRSIASGDANRIDAYSATGNAFSVLSGRISYLLGLQGPCLSVDTACSSSLVSVHLACQALRNGECETALAGGVNLILSPELTIGFSQLQAMSPTGHCQAFADGADGYVRSEGCGVVVLKPLSKAIEDGSNVLAVIKGSAINQDGRSNGLTAPNGPSQQAVIRKAMANARVEANEVGYVEAHGTGTELGDPIEMQALAAVMCADREKEQPLLVGSLKSNIGHTEGAAGISSLIKLALSLKNRTIPASLHFNKPSPHIPWDKIAVKVPTESTPWEAIGERRLAGVSSFGFSGTNAHIILEEAPEAKPRKSAPALSSQLIPLSGRSEKAMREAAARLAGHLKEQPDLSLAALGHSARVGRGHFDYRAAMVVDNKEKLTQAAESLARGGEPEGGFVRSIKSAGPFPKVAFLFTGQGSQYINMSRGLYESEPVFKAVLEQCDEILEPLLERPLLSVLFPAEGESSPIDETAFTQPALFAVEYALALLWRSWGVQPDVVMGHSVGEYVAACLAGVFSLEDGLKLIAARGRLMQALPEGGAMAAIRADEARVAAAISKYEELVSIAAVNGPKNVVISGDCDSLRAICGILEIEEIKTTSLNVSHAFHSPLMEPMLDEFEKVAAELTFSKPLIPLVSNLDGAMATEAVATVEYWRSHVRQPVRFAAGMNTLHEQKVNIFIEVGPDPVLLGMGAGCVPSGDSLWLPSLRKSRDAHPVLLESLAQLYVNGGNVDWERFDHGRPAALVPLPSYPWQRARHWIEPIPAGGGGRAGAGHALLGERFEAIASRPDDCTWQLRLDPESQPLLAGEKVEDVAVLSLAGLTQLAIVGGREAPLDGTLELTDLTMEQALLLNADAKDELQLCLERKADGQAAIQFFHRGDHKSAWARVGDGSLRPLAVVEGGSFSLESAKESCATQLYDESCKTTLEEIGIAPAGLGLNEVWTGEGEVLARMSAPEGSEQRRLQHLTSVAGILAGVAAGSSSWWEPHALESLRTYGMPPESFWLHIHWSSEGEGGLTLRAQAADLEGTLLAELDGLRLSAVEASEFNRRAGRDPLKDYFYDLEWRRVDASGSGSSSDQGHWLILSDRGGVAKALAQTLETAGDSCTLISQEDPNARNAIEDCLRQPHPWLGVVHLWSLDTRGNSELSLDSLEEARAATTESALELLRTLGSLAAAPRLFFVTRGVMSVESGSANVAAAPLWGLARVISLELDALWGGMVDLDPESGAGEVESLARWLREPGADDQIAFRKGKISAPRLVRSSVATAPTPMTLREDRSYLITGGLGGLGLAVARWMVERGARKLVLTSRRGLPPRDRWASLGDQALLRRIDAVKALEAEGAQVLAPAINVSDRDGMIELVQGLEAPLGGIVHAAGISSVEPLTSENNLNILKSTLEPKVQGSWVLHEVSADAPLDFFVLFSSVASVWGGQGQGFYAAANTFLDALAAYRRNAGLPATSINWGPWAEGGMTTAEAEKLLKAIGLTSMPTDLGLEAMERILAADLTQQTVSKVDWATFKPIYEVRGERKILEEIQVLADIASGGDSDFVKSLEGLSVEKARERLADLIADEVGKVLGYAADQAVPLHRGFVDMGMDSLMAVQLMNKLKKYLGREMPTTLIYEQSNIASLTEYLASELLHLDERENKADEAATVDENVSESELVSQLADMLADFD